MAKICPICRKKTIIVFHRSNEYRCLDELRTEVTISDRAKCDNPDCPFDGHIQIGKTRIISRRKRKSRESIPL